MSKHLLFYFGCTTIFLSSCIPNDKNNHFNVIKVNYPNTPRDLSIVDTFFGVPVADPYRWLENPNSPTTKDWIAQQQQVTLDYLRKIYFRETIRKRLQELWNHERYSSPQRKGDFYYILKNNGLQNKNILYRSRTLQDTNWTVVLDPNEFSRNGTLGHFAFSNDGSMLAYEVSVGGADWRTILLRDLEFNRPLLDTLRGVKCNEIAWFRDGFYYSRYPAPRQGEAFIGSNVFHQVFYHKIGTPQSEDVLIFADRTHPKRNFTVNITEDERFLILSAIESTNGNALYFKDMSSNSIEFEPIIESFNTTFQFVGNIGDNLLVRTNYKAPNYRLIGININRPEERYWEEIIAPTGDVLRGAYLFGGKLVTDYIRGASSRVRIFDLQGNILQEIQLPDIGKVADWQGDRNEYRCFFSFTSFTRPATVFELNLNDYSISPFRTPQASFNGRDYEVRQIRYNSFDNTQVNMFIIAKKGLKMDGKRPTLLVGNGGLNISLLPEYNHLFPIILENNGVCAVANIRGGGEFGENWHQAAAKTSKQKSFDDFQAAAEYLITNNYTSAEKLAIYGHSNGGLLTGACVTQRPDLYRVAVSASGLLDMLRYQQFTTGWILADEYGTANNQQEFNALKTYSPVHNVVPARYPAVLLTTATRDDRIVSMHSYKFAAELQANQQNDLPVLVRIDANAGHDTHTKTTSQQIEETADVLSFIFYNLQEKVVSKK